jgi:hypothetical protein
VIARVIRTARKLRGRDLRELRERGAQAVAAWRERAGLAPDARLPGDWAFQRALAAGTPADPGALHAHFRARRDRHEGPPPVPFFPGFDDRRATLAALRQRCPDDAADVVARADRIRAGQFDLLGYAGLSYGMPIDWHRDPIAGRRAPLVHWSRVPYLDPGAVGDHKVVWEVNRHQYFVTLGQAYWYTGRDAYSKTFAEHVGAWMHANPPKVGINWASSLEVAYRAISWLWALHFFRDSPALSPALLARMLKHLYLHARHLERYLSTYFSPNTHLTGEALGLYCLGTLLPEFRAAPRWRETGRAILLEQLGRQVRTDGVHFEQASQYHRYTTEIYLHFLLLAARHRDPAEPVLRDAVQRLLDHLLYLARPDGTVPLVGDDDGGRLVQLDGRAPDDVRALLATGAAVFGRADYAFGARGAAPAAVLWLLGADAGRRLDALRAEPPADLPRAFPEGGYFVMRDGWGPEANYLLVDCGPHGAMNCGHAHADALAVTASVRGRPALVDSGTYTYSGPERDAFRAGEAHNAVSVDGTGSSVPGGGAFQWRHVARCEPRLWAASDRFQFVEGAHDGFARLPSPAEHVRGVLFVRGEYWVVRDRVTSAGPHEVTVRWHVAPGLRARAASPDVVDVADGEPLFQLVAFGSGAFSVGDGWVSPQYGARERAAVCAYTQAGGGTQEVITFLIPAPAHAPAPRVREVAAHGGRAFLIDGPAGRDVLLLGSGGRVESDDVEADAEWAWVRRPAAHADHGSETECLLVRGSMLLVGGRKVLGGGRRHEWLTGAIGAERDAGRAPADQRAGGTAERRELETSGNGRRIDAGAPRR